jgi:hypothetical protein
MNFEELQKAWQSQGPAPRLTLHADLVLREVEHNRKHFVRMIFWRDMREVVVAIAVAPIFFKVGLEYGDWVWFAPGLAALGVAFFLLGDRWVRRKQKPAASDPLGACIQASLMQVNHQIWLLKNVLWWYLLPLGLSCEMIFIFAVWRVRSGGAGVSWMCLSSILGLPLLYYGIYWLNQYAVRKGFEPRRQELEALLADLDRY